jgi:hypothetical protein
MDRLSDPMDHIDLSIDLSGVGGPLRDTGVALGNQ